MTAVTIACVNDSTIKAVLGPTNTGKTHLAIERMCAHSSGMIGFPLRLLAREVYDRVRAIKGDKAVALITGEERIEPPEARYFCCTVEAMDRLGAGKNGPHAFVALDEAQLAADPERGHIFTDRLLNARGREETMLLGSATLEPMVRALVPGAELVERPRFSALSHAGSCKLSRLPPRSAVVAFSSEQVYAMAEMLRRFRGGAAVVMGALSPETRNKQVELFQNGEVDYIVATDAIGMGLNLDLHHVAFAALGKFDGRRKRRLFPAEMAQIAGRAGRHQRDGTFGVLGGGRGGNGAPPEFTEEEIYAVEEHRFAPVTKLLWRDAEPRLDTLGTLLSDLERPPQEPQLCSAPEAIDLAVLRKLADEPLAQSVKGYGQVQRFWQVCSLPDFRQSGVDTHARFVARLWQDLREGYIGADFVAARIAELDRVQGDIDTLQGRIAAIRSWAYICQRPDWVLARDEMAARARAVEARLSDALHGRLTERFVNRRTAILIKSLGQDSMGLPVTLEQDDRLTVEGEVIGRLDGFRFVVAPDATVADRKMLLAAGEKALPGLLAQRARWLLSEGLEQLNLEGGAILWNGQKLAQVEMPADFAQQRLNLDRDITKLPDVECKKLEGGLGAWLTQLLAPLDSMRKLAAATNDADAGSQARALLHTLIAGHGVVSREHAGLEHLPKEMRPFLRRLGVTFGALDIFAAALLKPAPRQLLHALDIDKRPLNEAMLPVLAEAKQLPAGYRPAGKQAIRVDLAEKILRAAFDARAKSAEKLFRLDPALAISIGLEESNFQRLLVDAGFKLQRGRTLPAEAQGPPAPNLWNWRPRRSGGQSGTRPAGKRQQSHSGNRKPGNAKGKPRNQVNQRRNESNSGNQADFGPAKASGAFDALADLLK